MLRIVVQTSDAGMAVNVGGHVEVEVKTFDINAPELEEFLREYADAQTKARNSTSSIYWSRSVIGVEIVD